jgi:hypothetical protein
LLLSSAIKANNFLFTADLSNLDVGCSTIPGPSLDVTDAAIALGVIAGEDPLDPRTVGSTAKAQPGPYTRYLTPSRENALAFLLSFLTGQGFRFKACPRPSQRKR